MPEGPEIRRAADRLGAALAGKKTVEVYFGLPLLAPWGDELSGRLVRSVRARGKALLITFSGGRHVYSHNQLYGRWYVRKPHDLPRTRRSLRLAIHNRSASALLYSASEIEVLDRRQVAGHVYLSRLGPDPLEGSTSWKQIAVRATERRFRRRGLGALLLDQSFVAGLGNYLRTEILFFSRLHPARRPIDLSTAELDALAEQAVEITQRSYATAGITNDPSWAAARKSSGAPRSRYRHAVFGLEGRPCPRCSTPVEKCSFAGRRLYLCPACQVA